MQAILSGLSIVALAGTGVILGIFLNSRNTIGIINAVGNLFIGTFNSAASTIR